MTVSMEGGCWCGVWAPGRSVRSMFKTDNGCKNFYLDDGVPGPRGNLGAELGRIQEEAAGLHLAAGDDLAARPRGPRLQTLPRVADIAS